jgi:hypothetical protein
MRRALALSVPLLLLSACSYDNGDAQRIVFDPQPVECGSQPSTPPTIDTDATLPVDPGVSTGVYVEYAAGGHWHVRTTCDTGTDKSTPSCAWDVLVFPQDGHALSNVSGEDLEPDDSLGAYEPSPAGYELLATTGSDVDGFTFDSDPGIAIKLDVLLDGTCSDSLTRVFWKGDGALHPGAPSNPLILMPSSK